MAEENDPKSYRGEILRMTAAVRDYRAGMAPDALRQKLGLSTITWADTGDKIRRLAQPPL